MSNEKVSQAPGAPGDQARWTSSKKSGIGKSLNTASAVAFTLGSGIVNEVFYPREDVACLKDFGFVVTDGKSFCSDERTDTHQQIEWMGEGVPAFRLVNTCKSDRYVIEKEIITDPIRSTLLQKIRFTGGKSDSELQLFAILSPHILGKGMGNSGRKGSYKGVPMLFASRENTTVALAFSTDILKCSVGFIGVSDGFTDLGKHFCMQWEYDEANDGNIALTAQLKLDEEIIVAVGFGQSEAEAGNNAWSSMLDGFDVAKDKYFFEWQRWQRRLRNIKSQNNRLGRDFRKSAAILRIHESRAFPGGIMASLSKPWGDVLDDENGTGYHMVWPRDLALSSGGFLELDAKDDVQRILNYLFSTQEADGRWPQNMWLAGVPHWTGVQMDQISFPILMMGTAYEKEHIDYARCQRYWPLAKKALKYILSNGPYTEQDRWEEEAGYTPFTLALQITALIAGAILAEAMGDQKLAHYCRQIADSWNRNIENWTYVSDTPISRRLNIDGYYVRINPYNRNVNDVKKEMIHLKNHADGEGAVEIGELVSVDALALVRFGLRSASDPKILNTVKVIDSVLKVNTPAGPCWHRYNNDGYGEDDAGNPYPVSEQRGIGRAWPLLTGERAHYEIAAGNIDKARKLLRTMESFTNNALLPEQIWDTDDIAEKNLFRGRPSGSAMPLTWAHAEYLKLCSSLKDKRIVDSPIFNQDRYIKKATSSTIWIWRFENGLIEIPSGAVLRIQVQSPARIRYTLNGWQQMKETATSECTADIYYADIETEADTAGVDFTFYWIKNERWEGKDFRVRVNNPES